MLMTSLYRAKLEQDRAIALLMSRRSMLTPPEDEERPLAEGNTTRRSRLGLVLLWSAGIACPCHFPIIVLLLLGGTVLGVYVHTHFVLLFAASVAYFALALLLGMWLLRRAHTRRGATCTRQGTGEAHQDEHNDADDERNQNRRRKRSQAGILHIVTRSIAAWGRLFYPFQHSSAAIYDEMAIQYDTFAALWDSVAGDKATKRLQTLIHHHIHPGASVLDVGSGTGRGIALILKETQPRRVVGVDLSARMLDRARKKLTDPRVELLQADAMHLPFADDTFDVVTCLWMLETLPDPLAAVHELLRVVRPEGRVITAFSTLPSELLPRLRAELMELVMKPLFAGHFLTEEERPLHTCTMQCTHRDIYNFVTIATFGKYCELKTVPLPRNHLSLHP